MTLTQDKAEYCVNFLLGDPLRCTVWYCVPRTVVNVRRYNHLSVRNIGPHCNINHPHELVLLSPSVDTQQHGVLHVSKARMLFPYL